MNTRKTAARGCSSRRGVSLLLVSFTVTGLALVSLALFTTVSSTGKAQKGSRDGLNAKLVTEAGLAEATLQLSRGENAALGSKQQPVAYGSASFWVEHEVGGQPGEALASGLHRLTAFGVENGVGSRIELVVREVSSSFFRFAAFGDERMTMASNALVDSYDSSDGAYEDQDVNGSGSGAYANDDGNIGSNGNVGLSQNAMVFGDATPGPAGTVTALGNSVISGSTAPATGLVDMPAIVVPSIASTGDVTVGKNGAYSIASGNHHIGAFVVGSNADITITGPATLVFDSFNLGSNSEFIVNATNGAVEIYVIGDFVMNSNTLIASTTRTPADISINLLSDNIIDPGMEIDLDEVDFDSNAQLYGTIYAPNAAVEINSNFELFGSLMARSVHLDSNARIHFDEALLQVDGDEEILLETVAWRQLAYRP
jgi:hypothetical protein